MDTVPFGHIEELAIAERAVDMLEEWIERWKRSRRQDDDDFNSGRREGYIQTIAYLLDRPVKEVRLALEKGQL